MSRLQYLKFKGWRKIWSTLYYSYRYTHSDCWSKFHRDVGHPSLDLAWSIQKHWEEKGKPSQVCSVCNGTGRI